jgi:sugar (pentulose or hexulose) kinase
MKNKEHRREELILSIDAGTQSIRAALIDLKGEIRDLVKTPIEPYFSAHPGWAEQAPEYYWNLLGQTCRELLRRSAEMKKNIQGVTLTTQRGTMINLDKNGKPLRPAIVWLDQRKADAWKVLPGMAKPIVKSLKFLNLLEGVVRDCEANWIRQNQPEIWEKTHKYLFISGYLTYRLTGEFIDSSANMVGYIPFNIKTGQWAHKLDPKWRLFPIEKDKLPGLAAPTELLGHISSQASAETGIPTGLPLIAAANDKACEILGSGCLTPETLCISFGTTATVNAQNEKYVELRPFWPPFPSAIPGQYYTEVAVLRGTWMITWFKEEFGLQERLEALEGKASPEELLEKLIKGVPPGSMGLVLQPYWTPGPEVAWYSKGAIVGFGDVHTRSHLYRAIVEGMVFALKDGARLTEKKNKTPVTGITVSGGGSQSDAIVQIVADIFGLPVQRPHTHETSALGAAIDAAVGLKFYPDFPAAVKAMSRIKEVFHPLPENQDLYRELYHRVYSKMYKRLQPLDKEIQDITGYPSNF